MVTKKVRALGISEEVDPCSEWAIDAQHYKGKDPVDLVYRAFGSLSYLERKTRFELATSSLARRYSERSTLNL